MANNYYNPYTPEDNPFIVSKPQTQQQQGGLSGLSGIMPLMNIAKGGGGFLGGGSGAGATAATPMAGAGGTAGAASTGGSTAASGAGSALASAGPWAALAALIFANEMSAKDKYRRPDDKEHMQDLFSGEVMHQDIEKRWLPGLGIKEGTGLSKALSFMANPLTGDVGRSFERIKDIF